MEKSCWMCRRTENELLKDLKNTLNAVGFDEEDKRNIIFDETNIMGEQKVKVCKGCSFIIYNMMHNRDDPIDEMNLVEFQDLDCMIDDLIESLKNFKER